jgi:hypothetical protein
MFAGDNWRRSKDRNCHRLSLAKIGQRLSGSDARRPRSAKIDIDLETLVAMGTAAVVTRAAQALETAYPVHAEVASKTNSCQPFFNGSQLQRFTPLKNVIAKPAASKIAMRSSSLIHGFRSGGNRDLSSGNLAAMACAICVLFETESVFFTFA